jgi:hypothetical protein
MLEAATQELAEMSRRCQEEFANAARSLGIASPDATNSTTSDGCDGSTDENSCDEDEHNERRKKVDNEEEGDLDVVSTTTSDLKKPDTEERSKPESPASLEPKLLPPFPHPAIPSMFNLNAMPHPQFVPPMFPNNHQGQFFHAAAAAAAVYCGWYPPISITSPPVPHPAAPSIFQNYLRSQRFNPYAVPNNNNHHFSPPNFGQKPEEPISPTNLSTSSRSSSSDSASPTSSSTPLHPNRRVILPRDKSSSPLPAAPASIRSIESLLTTASSASSPFTSV